MRMAKLSPATARRMHLSSNHHARVWCDCMDHPLHSPGAIPSGLYANPDRSVEAIRADPRRLWSFDALGIVDLRVANSAIDLWRTHVRSFENA